MPKLTEQRDNLAPVVRRMIDHVKNRLPERKRRFLTGNIGVRQRRLEFLVRQRAEEFCSIISRLFPKPAECRGVRQLSVHRPLSWV